MENYLDGLDFLIKNRICIVGDIELKNGRSDLCRAFKKLFDAAEERQIGYYRPSAELQHEIDELSEVLNKKIASLGRKRLAPYYLYLAIREILSVGIACPYLLPRMTMYNLFRRGLIEQLY